MLCNLHFVSSTNDVNTTTKTIHSPNWPLPYYAKAPESGFSTCTWRIKVDEGVDTMKFLFTKMDTRTPYRSSRLCYHRGNDYVRIKGMTRNLIAYEQMRNGKILF